MPPEAPPPPSRRSLLASASLFFLGVVLPWAALGVEAWTGMCAGTFVDPLATPLHTALVLGVALTNTLTWNRVRRGRLRDPAPLVRANGAALGVAAFYSLLFLPLLPLSFPALAAWGLGFLIWAPYGALFLAAWDRRALRALSPHPEAVPAPWRMMAAAWVLLSLADVPAALTQVGLNLAASEEPATARRGLRVLRRFGDREELLRRCHWSTHSHLSPLALVVRWGLPPVYPYEARGLFYQVTGSSFDAFPRPPGGSFFDGEFRGEWDLGQGGSAVGPKLRGLELGESRLLGSVDARAALAYLEWTLVLGNRSHRDREARFEIRLPPGAVVSRATLWVGDEPREAAFASRVAAQEAYRAVVRTQRDPLLVTTRGPGRVLVQCFPVLPEQRMQIRLGITQPLTVPRASESFLTLPRIAASNFRLPDDFPHHLLVAASTPLEPAPFPDPALRPAGWLQPRQGPPGEPGVEILPGSPDAPHQVGGQVPQWALGQPLSRIRAPRGDAPALSWCRDPRSQPPGVVRQELVPATREPPGKLVLVVDGSGSMAPHADAIARALGELPPGAEVALVFAAPERAPLPPPADSRPFPGEELAPRSARQLAELAERVASFPYVGGQDNGPALVRALHLAPPGQGGGPLVLWLHGPQPLEASPAAASLPRRVPGGEGAPPWSPSRAPVVSLQFTPGVDHLGTHLASYLRPLPPPFTGEARADLELLVAAWGGHSPGLEPVRSRTPEPPGPPSHPTSDHLARLLVHREILDRPPGEHPRAVELARRYQLVTPVSGAVVLETQAQYDASGLEPADPARVPTIPEPGTWLLLLLAGGGLLGSGRRPRSPPR